MKQDLGAPASPSGSQASPEAADASSPSVSIPSADEAFGWLPKIWPFGHGCITTGICVADGIGVFAIRAVPDGFHSEDGASPVEAWEASNRYSAPSIMLTFDTTLAAEQMANDLLALASAMSARSGETEGLDPQGDSAAPEGGDAQ